MSTRLSDIRHFAFLPCNRKSATPTLARYVQWTISLVYATRRTYSIDVAMEILVDAEAKFPREPAIPYNLACYHCQLGETETAKRYLKKAFEIDLNWRMAALEDEDLRPLWDSLQTTVE